MKFLRLLTRSLLLVAIAMLSAMTAMRLAIHGREVRVPDLVGMTTQQAQTTATGSGLVIVVEDKFFSPEVPAGRIMSQLPAANSKVRRGWRVRVAESLGPQKVTIPDVVGESERAATINLRRRGLDLSTVAAVPVPDADEGEVVAQSPPPNAAGVVSPRIGILLARKPDVPDFVMPNFVGRSLPEARAQIAAAGMQIEIANSDAPGLPNDSIVSQSPPAGSRIAGGATVRLQVAHCTAGCTTQPATTVTAGPSK
jgi:beta-lactam-binding protein with PASTA domain